jgi:hypothetical protein
VRAFPSAIAASCYLFCFSAAGGDIHVEAGQTVCLDRSLALEYLRQRPRDAAGAARLRCFPMTAPAIGREIGQALVDAKGNRAVLVELAGSTGQPMMSAYLLQPAAALTVPQRPVATPRPAPRATPAWPAPFSAAAVPLVSANVESPTDSPSPPPRPTVPTQGTQDQFVAAVVAAREAYRAGANDMAKGAARPARAKAICNTLIGPTVQNWTGRVATLSSNGDGLGVLSVQIGPDVWVTTWNNAISDYADKTLISPNSNVFSKAVALTVGQYVVFSGRFIADLRVDCVRERSVTIDGSMTSPEYIFRFSDIRPQAP